MPARETVEIGGTTYVISKFDAFDGLKILGDLQRQFLAPLLSVLDGKEAGNPEAVTAGLMAGVERVARDMDGDKLVAMAKRLLSPDHIFVDWEGERRRLDKGTLAMMQLDVADIIELCLAVIQTNFARVFQRAASLIGAARLPTPTPASPGSGSSSPLN